MLVQQLKEANINALKAHDTTARSVLSVILNKVKLAEIDRRSEGKELSAADVVAILQKSVKELTEEREVHSARRHNVRAVTVCARHEECGDIRHHARHGVGARLRKLFNLILRYTDVIQPFHADLLAGALAHRLFDVIAGLVGEQAIDPHKAVTLRLCFELRLAVDGPA